SQTPNGHRPAAKLAEVRLDFIEQDLFLAIVHAFHRGQDAGVIAHFFSRTLQGLDVLRETRTAVPHPRIDEGVADARVAAQANAHRLDVGPESFGQVRQFVHETDL